SFGSAAQRGGSTTHMKRLRDAGGALQRFLFPPRPLGKRWEVVLWQLPPRLEADLRRLKAFLRLLPRRYRHAVEFRELAWYTSEVAGVLDTHQVAFCEHDLLPLDPPRITPRFPYL